jgi:TAT (twin-arginine translocation) pathway signal sequence
MSATPSRRSKSKPNRREFLKTAGVAAGAATVAAGLVGPTILGAQDKSGTKNPVIGTGAHTYEVIHNWGVLPSEVPAWGETHGVTVDAAGLIYIKHRSHAEKPIPSIVVFDETGKAVRSFGTEYHRGGHGIDLRKEGNEEFLYLCDVFNRQVIKTTLTGEQLWRMCYPLEAGVYQKMSQFSPTNVAFSLDGGFYVADGYGSSYIHQYDKQGKWIRTWGGAGSEPGKMATPHGLWLDDRPGRVPSLCVADRANKRLQYFTPDGKHIGFVSDVLFPAHVDIRGSEMLISDLHARVSIFDQDNKAIVHLGHDPKWTEQCLADNFAMRKDPSRWQPGKFVHPHDACWDKEGNIYVVEWVPTGRVTKLRKV